MRRMPPPPAPVDGAKATVAVDLRALVPEATGIGVYTRSLLLALARRGRFAYLGLAHRPPRGADELAAAGVRLVHDPAPLGVLWQQLRLPRRLAARALMPPAPPTSSGRRSPPSPWPVRCRRWSPSTT